MRVFLTGATGFVGRYVALRLAAGGHELVCLVRRPERARTLAHLGARLVPGDVLDRAALEAGMRGCACLVHLANVYSLWEPDRSVYRRVNVAGTRCVLEAALATGVAKVVHVSTMGVYGEPAERPFAEDTPVGPVRFSAYAESKYQGDLVAWRLYGERGLPLVVVYPGTILGVGDTKASGDYVRDFVRRRLPAVVFPHSVMTYVHARDVAEAIVLVAEQDGNVGERYLLGAERLALRDLNELIGEVSGVRPPRLHVPDRTAILSAALLTRLADCTKRPPPWGLSRDAVRTLAHGFRGDGSKAARDLGIGYTPVRRAIAEMVAAAR